MLIRKAYETLPEGGCLIAIENVIDDDRRRNTFGLLMSLNMLIETNDGFDYTHAQFKILVSRGGVPCHRAQAADRPDQRGDRLQMKLPAQRKAGSELILNPPARSVRNRLSPPAKSWPPLPNREEGRVLVR